MRILLFGNKYKPTLTEKMTKLLARLEADGVMVMFEREYSEYVCDVSGREVLNYPTFDAVPEADIAISLGGDGTFLSTAAKIGNRGIPILGINRGRLGFLTDVRETELDTLYDTLSTKLYTIEERAVLRVDIVDNDVSSTRYALNEVALLKQDLSSMISIEARVGDDLLNMYQADGLIVSTPTGSTAYCLSVGGPIMMPETHNLIVAPVASHSMNVRPLIIPDSWNLSLKVSSRSHSFLASVDGGSIVLPDTAVVKVGLADYTVRTIRLDGHTFLDTLRQKLLWGADVRS